MLLAIVRPAGAGDHRSDVIVQKVLAAWDQRHAKWYLDPTGWNVGMSCANESCGHQRRVSV